MKSIVKNKEIKVKIWKKNEMQNWQKEEEEENGKIVLYAFINFPTYSRSHSL